MGSPALGQGSNCKLDTVSMDSSMRLAGYSQGILQMLIDLHYGSLVPATIAVVWR